MPFPDWREPARLLAVSYGPPTEAQAALAEHAELDLPDDTPHDVAAALLIDALAPTLTLAPPGPPTHGQLEYLHDLGHEWRMAPWKATRRVASALIVVLVSRQRVRTLQTLRPASGDLVGVSRPPRHDDEVVFLLDRPHARPLPPSVVVSSVSASGRVNFRGGSGLAAWPEHVTMLARAADVWTSPTEGWSQPTLFER
ncbi:MAG: hypothetical protein JWO02_232 [Solirubrobacterales bacterium]|nr:hypothetical protein [Solirubrobacterales bacterium]